MDKTQWPKMKKKLDSIFRKKTRDDWCNIMEGKDVCFTPVLSIKEAYQHPHNKGRKLFLKRGEKIEPAPAPRFSRTPGKIKETKNISNTKAANDLSSWDISNDDIKNFLFEP